MRVLFPDDLQVIKSLAVTSLAAGDAEGALALADELRAKAGAEDMAALDAVRGKALFALGRVDEARGALTRSLTLRATAAATPSTNGKAP